MRVVVILYAALLFIACQPRPAVLLTHLGTTIPRDFTRPNVETIALGDTLPSDLRARSGASTAAGSVVAQLIVPPEAEAMDDAKARARMESHLEEIRQFDGKNGPAAATAGPNSAT